MIYLNQNMLNMIDLNKEDVNNQKGHLCQKRKAIGCLLHFIFIKTFSYLLATLTTLRIIIEF